MTPSSVFPNIIVPCCQRRHVEYGCLCGPEERILRTYADRTGTAPSLPPMTAAQRQWCIREATTVGGKMFPRERLEALDDVTLAEAVLKAWAISAQKHFKNDW